MGNYNPHAPRILGQEWVPIRDEGLVYSPAVNTVELGHTFGLTASRTIKDIRFYLNEPPPGDPFGQTFVTSIYKKGTEDLSGPIERVIIPCTFGIITGGSGVVSPTGATIPEALLSPADNRRVETVPLNTMQLLLMFGVDQYMPLLIGKRILNVAFLYTATLFNGAAGQEETPLGWSCSLRSGAGVSVASFGFLTGPDSLSTISQTQINRISLGEVDLAFNNSSTETEVLPWSPSRLLGFKTGVGTAGRQISLFLNGATAGVQTYALQYAALEVLYCEEQRLVWGGRQFTQGSLFTLNVNTRYIIGMNAIAARATSTDALNPVLPPDDYAVTLASANLGDRQNTVQAPYPTLNGIRELYQIPSHQGVRLLVPFPADESIVGEVFETEETHILPQLSVHTSGGPMTEPHVYGRQAIAQVYGSITATQEIQDGLANGSASWPWVRYIARRFGDTTVPLNLAIVGQSVSITPTEFDALDEILDGWKEVTLRFTTPPTMGTGTNPQAVWSATGELAGNRWEVLGVCAPAVSGIGGNLYNLVPSPDQLSIATYGMPVSGAVINLGWVPQGVGSPPVSGTTDDQTSDAFIIFSQDMPAVSGFTVSTLSQAISGIGQDCGLDPCCIPTAILYNQLTWTAGPAEGLSLPGTSGSYATTPDNAALDITGDIDLRADITMDDWTPTTEATLISKWGFLQASYAINIATTGHVLLYWTPDGVSTQIRSSTIAPVIANGTRLAIRATLDVDNGAAGHTVTFYTAPTITGPWTQLGAQVITAGVVSIHSGTATVDITGIFGTTNLWAGTVHAAEILNGIGGSAVANPNFMVQVPGTTVFTDAAGRTWTINGSAAIVGFSDASIEIQRQDTVETEWKTIMLASGTDVSSFRDYEARTGIATSYRIRGVNVYDFPGPWSSTITSTIPSPGVSGGCVSDGHILIFTSNEQQDGSLNLAYSSVWMDSQVTEDFNFSEAGFVQLQAMYDRDFYVAFRPLERGGEQFTRTVLVQAAAIAPETLADFQSLRDMAWSTVNYICVRDEDGNRWFASIGVPSGRVLRDRRLYLAPVNIVEVTDTPTPVDP